MNIKHTKEVIQQIEATAKRLNTMANMPWTGNLREEAMQEERVSNLTEEYQLLVINNIKTIMEAAKIGLEVN